MSVAATCNFNDNMFQISMNVKLYLIRVLQMEGVLTPMGISPVNAIMGGQVIFV